VPLATAYSLAEGEGEPASLDLDSRHFQHFDVAFVALTVAAAGVVSWPGIPLIPLIYFSQVGNAILLPLHVIALQFLAADRQVVGQATLGKGTLVVGWVGVGVIVVCVGGLLMNWIS